MKIAMIGQKGIPTASGGVERHVEEICTRLVNEGHQVTVYNRKGYSNISDVYKGINLEETFTVRSKNLEAIIYSLISSVKVIFQDYDIVHYHALGPSTMSFIPRLFGKKVVTTVHGLDWMRAKWGTLAKLYLKLGEFSSIRFANRTIAVSKTLSSYLTNKYGKDVAYIPNGIPAVDILSPKEIIKYGLEKNNYILYLARLVPEKGCHYLIDAFNKIKTSKKLVIAGGSGHTDDYVENLKNSSFANKNIIFTGEVRGSILKELLSNAYMYVLPSEIEGLPISLLEAMSYERGCLVSNIPENLEVIQENGAEKYGLSFANKDVDDLVLKLEFMLNNPGIINLIGIEAKNHVEKNYNWDSVTNQTLQFYMEGCNFDKHLKKGA